MRHGEACLEPALVSIARLARGQRELLVRWKGQGLADATWVAIDEFCKLYPAFRLADKLLLQEGRDVMCGMHQR
jgi:hypothetical protein